MRKHLWFDSVKPTSKPTQASDIWILTFTWKSTNLSGSECSWMCVCACPGHWGMFPLCLRLVKLAAHQCLHLQHWATAEIESKTTAEDSRWTVIPTSSYSSHTKIRPKNNAPSSPLVRLKQYTADHAIFYSLSVSCCPIKAQESCFSVVSS